MQIKTVAHTGVLNAIHTSIGKDSASLLTFSWSCFFFLRTTLLRESAAQYPANALVKGETEVALDNQD